MKRYLTAIFIVCSILTVVIGFRFDVRWNGIVSWGLALILLIFAAYFTKYISNVETEQKETHLTKCKEEHS